MGGMLLILNFSCPRLLLLQFKNPKNKKSLTWSNNNCVTSCSSCRQYKKQIRITIITLYLSSAVFIAIESNVVKYPSWQKADQLPILQAWPRSWTQGYWETTPASSQSGTWTKVLRISSPAPEPLDHSASLKWKLKEWLINWWKAAQHIINFLGTTIRNWSCYLHLPWRLFFCHFGLHCLMSACALTLSVRLTVWSAKIWSWWSTTASPLCRVKYSGMFFWEPTQSYTSWNHKYENFCCQTDLYIK